MIPNAYETASRGAWNQEQIEQYLPLVKRVAGRLMMFLPSHADEDDIIGYGVFGLLDALERFEAARGWKFETYASIRIRGAMIDGLRIMDWVPHSARQKVKRVQECFGKLEYRLGRAVTVQEVADFLKVEVREIEKTLALAQTLTLTSFEVTTGDNEGDSSNKPLNLLIDTQAQDAFQAVEKEELKQFLAAAVEKLPAKEKIVVALYYQDELTLKEIAAILKLSESRISQLHSQAILRLRGRLNRQKKNLL